METVKFRAWDKIQNKMIHSFVMKNDGTVYNSDEYGNLTGSIPKEDIVLMQYVGKKDKKGIEIFDGDIVNGAEFNGSYAFGYVAYNKKSCEFLIYPIGRMMEGCSYIKSSQIEVIGNVYENNELFIV